MLVLLHITVFYLHYIKVHPNVDHIHHQHLVKYVIRPIPWGHSGPLSRVVVVVVVDIDAQAARDSTASDIWWIGVRRLVVANGPNIFQMLLVYHIFRHKTRRVWYVNITSHGSVYSSDTHVVFKDTLNAGMLRNVTSHTWCIRRQTVLHHMPDS